MEIEEIAQILNVATTNKYKFLQNNLNEDTRIFDLFDDKTQDIIINILEKCNAEDFKEINPKADFDFTDIPIPYQQLEKVKSDKKKSTLSPEIQAKLKDLHTQINKEGTNIEYPFLIGGAKEEKDTYSHIKSFEVKSEENATQSCSYDWKFIEETIAKTNDIPKHYALLHTHPKAIGQEHNTLFNKYPEVLAELGVKPEGLNLSLSDILTNMFLDKLIKDNGKNIEAESLVLMHDGSLISFSTNN
ncbi:MAG: hypothetical protein RR400_03430, partial [Clostridia bacterium]